ncbi:MAG: hypothetical protein ACJ750_08495 [Gaiellaceae bacterium]
MRLLLLPHWRSPPWLAGSASGTKQLEALTLTPIGTYAAPRSSAL